ncbi:MAG: hypothetical protein IKL13_01820 [Clostridia bacterium]|nr:hypothetical protein [Clostridia bacterium]
MAGSANTPKKSSDSAKKAASIDAVYQKYARGVIRTLASSDFYEFFMDVISKANNEFQFSNRRCEKVIDPTWVVALEDSLKGFQNIIANPRNIIKEEELIVNVANAKRGGQDVVRHLAQHGNFVSSYDYDTHDVKPNKLMQKIRDDTNDLYENRLVYTVLESAHHFVRIRYDALFEAMGDEFGVKLKMQSDLECASEDIHFDMFMHIKQKQSALDMDEKAGDILSRVARLYRLLTVFMNSPFAQQMARLPRVRGTITKTNVLKKHPDYKAIVKLWECLKQYDDVGYAVKVVEQNPEVTEDFQRDLFHNLMFHYIVLKGYLEDEEDRKIPAPSKQRKRTLKPKFIREIIEELTEDYDLPDVEVRKVLIEQLTKEQLMQEEAAERRRLVEEQARLKKEEEARLRQEKAAEQERIRQEKEAERQRLQREKEAEAERLRVLQFEQDNEDRRRATIYTRELERFARYLPDQLEKRAKLDERQKVATKSDFSDAVEEMEAAERRRLSQAERERRRLAEEQKRQELAKQEEARLRQEERERHAAEQRKLDEAENRPFMLELAYFTERLPAAREDRRVFAQQLRAEREQFEAERQRRRQQRESTVLITD